MAKDKVTVDVNVDDKGTTKKVGLGAQGAAEPPERNCHRWFQLSPAIRQRQISHQLVST